MSPIITYILLVFIGLYVLTIIAELIIKRFVKRFMAESLLILIIIVILNLTTGFPVASTRQAFGGVSPITAIGIMFICTIFGIFARYFFYFKGKFSWRSFLKPIFISPIVFLPMIGSVRGISNLEIIQMISFGVLSFQNGFFWKEVFEYAKQI